MQSDIYIVGISCFYHDSAAVLLKNGSIVAAAQEERFSRIKNDESFPRSAIQYCLDSAGIQANEVSHVVFYEKPFLKFERIIDTYIRTWPWGIASFIRASITWAKTKLFIRHIISRELGYSGSILFVEHHLSHAASSYYTSPYTDAAIVSVDGVGEYATTTIGYGHGADVRITRSINFPHSLGLLYSAVTAYLGFKVNSGEFEVMGLAAYGDPARYRSQFTTLCNLRDDGSFALDMRYFSYEYGLSMTNSRFHALFGGKPRDPRSGITQREKDIAASLQECLEHAMARIASHAATLYPSKNLCLAGGVALNCKANGRIARDGSFARIHVPAVPGDAGGALGAALYVHHATLKNPKTPTALAHVYTGPAYSEQEIIDAAQEFETHLTYQRMSDEEVLDTAAALLSEGKILGWFQSRMEYGPRALGNRSILADPRRAEMKDRINREVKFRDDFRPFAPAIIAEDMDAYFEKTADSPYMSFVTAVIGTSVPAVTHVDGTARVQTVRREDNPRFYDLIARFKGITGCPMILNTSFNVKDEPIVLSPHDALRCFLSTGLDCVAIGNVVFSKRPASV